MRETIVTTTGAGASGRVTRGDAAELGERAGRRGGRLGVGHLDAQEHVGVGRDSGGVLSVNVRQPPVLLAIDPTAWLSRTVTAEGGNWLPLPDSFSS